MSRNSLACLRSPSRVIAAPILAAQGTLRDQFSGPDAAGLNDTAPSGLKVEVRQDYLTELGEGCCRSGRSSSPVQSVREFVPTDTTHFDSHQPHGQLLLLLLTRYLTVFEMTETSCSTAFLREILAATENCAAILTTSENLDGHSRCNRKLVLLFPPQALKST